MYFRGEEARFLGLLFLYTPNGFSDAFFIVLEI